MVKVGVGLAGDDANKILAAIFSQASKLSRYTMSQLVFIGYN